MASLLLDRTRHSDNENVNNLINSVKTLENIFQHGIDIKNDDEKIDTDEKMLSYQSEFWEAHMKCIDSCNDTYMTINVDAEPEKALKCCKKIWKFCCMVSMYHKMIHAKWPTTDLESRKLTILLAISDIERFRCEKNQKCNRNIKKEVNSIEFNQPDATSTPKNVYSANEYSPDEWPITSGDELQNNESSSDESPENEPEQSTLEAWKMKIRTTTKKRPINFVVQNIYTLFVRWHRFACEYLIRLGNDS